MHVGGRPEATTLTAREKHICDTIGPELKKRGLIFTGIDVIGYYLTEINVTSPTGIHEVRRFGGASFSSFASEVSVLRVRGGIRLAGSVEPEPSVGSSRLISASR